jgi:uncharacterized protein
MQTLAGQGAVPIADRERISTLDALRGFALLGILIMNMPGFNMPIYQSVAPDQWTMWWDRTARALTDVLFAGKFNGMFSMLLAVGFTIQLQRLRERVPEQAVAIYLRRLAWLFVFGLLHSCLWGGDVLHMYAILGLILLAVRNLSDRAIIGLIVVALIYPLVEGVILLWITTPEDTQRAVNFMRDLVARDYAAVESGSFWVAVQQSLRVWSATYVSPMSWYVVPRVYIVLLITALLGLLLGRRRFFQNVASYLPLVSRVQWWTLGAGIAMGAVYAFWSATVEQRQEPTVWRLFAVVCFRFSRLALMAFYVCLIIRAMQSVRWQRRLQPFVTMGRMPLTNYLMQTLIGMLIFAGWGLGYYGQVGPALGIVISLAIFFAIQVPFSRLWLGRFQMGPMEYLWRVLTYGKLPAIRQADSQGLRLK